MMKVDDEHLGFSPNFGARLAEVEASFGIKKRAADAAGVAPKTLRRWIAGGSDVSLGPLVRLAAASGYSLEWLVFDVGPKRRAPRLVGAGAKSELYEEISIHVSDFLEDHGQRLPRLRQHDLVEELCAHLARHDDQAVRRSLLLSLTEALVPRILASLTAHEKIDVLRPRPSDKPG